MRTPSLFDDILKERLNIHAAWLPVTNTFALGDFGLVSDGVLFKMGNIRSFGVSWSEADGPVSELDFASEGTRMIRTVDGAEVNVLPQQDIEAKVTIQFSRASSFLIKANLTVRQMQDVGAVAKRLRNLGDDWERRFRVVSGVYTGQQCTVLSSKDANSEIELIGKANALKQLDLGAVSAEVQVKSSDKIGLKIVGKTGVVGLNLFKLGWLGGVKVLGVPTVLEGGDGKVTVETEANWGRLENDV